MPLTLPPWSQVTGPRESNCPKSSQSTDWPATYEGAWHERFAQQAMSLTGLIRFPLIGDWTQAVQKGKVAERHRAEGRTRQLRLYWEDTGWGNSFKKKIKQSEKD